MNDKIDVVIGSNFGDEGKGHITHKLCQQYLNPMVVRFNGGAQAAHTVQVEGTRIVFHHFGSGAASGHPTYLGKEFIVNPILFLKELYEIGVAKVGVHPLCRVSTPYDMMFNQLLEKKRAGAKHGSCGIGINATVDRHERLQIYAKDLDSTGMKQILVYAYTDFLSICKLHGIELEGTVESTVIGTDMLHEAFAIQCMQMSKKVTIQDESYLNGYSLIFEGAQGLLLDEEHEWFPHVTRSRTGLTNVLAMLDKLPTKVSSIDAHYVTRAYMTRHGEGPFPTEREGLSYEDPTNVPNNWQGSMRFGFLDMDMLFGSIFDDFARSFEYGCTVQRILCVTCLDQVPELNVIHEGSTRYFTNGGFIEYMKDIWGGRVIESWGPEPKDIKEV